MAKTHALAPAAPIAELGALLQALSAAGSEIQITGYGGGKSGSAKKLGKRRAEALAKALGIYGVKTKGEGVGAADAQLRVVLLPPAEALRPRQSW